MLKSHLNCLLYWRICSQINRWMDGWMDRKVVLYFIYLQIEEKAIKIYCARVPSTLTSAWHCFVLLIVMQESFYDFLEFPSKLLNFNPFLLLSLSITRERILEGISFFFFSLLCNAMLQNNIYKTEKNRSLKRSSTNWCFFLYSKFLLLVYTLSVFGWEITSWPFWWSLMLLLHETNLKWPLALVSNLPRDSNLHPSL